MCFVFLFFNFFKTQKISLISRFPARSVGRALDFKSSGRGFKSLIGNAFSDAIFTSQSSSFSFFLVPAYLTINEVEPGDHLAISLYNEGVFSFTTDLVQGSVNVFEKIILYSQDRLAENASFGLGYGYRVSPIKQNLFVYPNPIRGNLLSYVYFGDGESTTLSVKLLDLNGSQILSTQSHIGIHNNYSGDLALSLSSGVYILQSVLNSGVSESRLISIIK